MGRLRSEHIPCQPRPFGYSKATSQMINVQELSSGKDRPIVTGRYVIELFKTALDATEFIRRVEKETGSRPRSWKVTSGEAIPEYVGLYSVELWLANAGSVVSFDNSVQPKEVLNQLKDKKIDVTIFIGLVKISFKVDSMYEALQLKEGVKNNLFTGINIYS
jgi:hypothetical protein